VCTELIIANKELLFQMKKEKTCSRIAVANKELAFQKKRKRS
jgi:hypothetical protein